MNKSEKIRQIYSILIGVFAVAVGIAFICVCADIYYSGRGTGVIFTREIVAKRLANLAIPLIVLIGVIAAGAIFPLYEVRAKHTSENAVKLLSARLPSGGETEEYKAAEKKYADWKKYRLILWCCVGAVVLGCTIASLCYLLNTAHFMGADITAEIFAMVAHVLPWIAVSFAVLVAGAVVNGIFASKQLKEIKIMIKCGNGAAKEQIEPAFVATAKKLLSSDITLWIVRGIVFVIAVTFIVLGAVNGGAHDVLIKAINICTECIGLG